MNEELERNRREACENLMKLILQVPVHVTEDELHMPLGVAHYIAQYAAQYLRANLSPDEVGVIEKFTAHLPDDVFVDEGEDGTNPSDSPDVT